MAMGGRPRPGGELPFHTVGHSNRSLGDFIDLLRESRVGRVLDIRKIPASRANPQFNGASLAGSLAAAGISYEHAAALGGLRKKDRSVPPDVNGFWTNGSFHNFADYALSAEFRKGLDRLVEAGRDQPTAIMCSEAVWWHCHRRIVADHLIARGETVQHILAQGRVEPARLTPGAVVQPEGAVVYPAA
jgi:uncharacterized protein (DUF488 family)